MPRAGAACFNPGGQMTSKEKRRIFRRSLVQQLHVIWPIVSGIILIMIGLGLVIGLIEEWRPGEALYFTFVTGLTIGYGDLVPRHMSSRVLAIIIGFTGIVLTGLIAAVSVQALRATEVPARDKRDEK
ncbi:potassium channel family protein [uncultured Bosea sp.]|uniref:potassium channel family protein n=1 Tax=uncultured Bosea sp. TaxID=211457 RepID=UPI0025CC995B|nr:potassium channel family protein [uncultured Bosea sp.]